MSRVTKRVAALVGVLAAVLLLMAVLYWLGMNHLEGKPRTFWQALQFAAGTTSTTGYGADTHWTHPVLVIFVVIAQFAGVLLIFMVFPIVVIPMLEERFETKLPDAVKGAHDHIVIFDFGPAVATLLTELEQAGIRAIVIEEDESEARHIHGLGHEVIHGNLDEGALERVCLLRARALVVNSTDDRNAAAILTARQLGYEGEIQALVEDPFHRHPLTLAGATGAITPRHALGAALAARASDKVSPMVAGIQHLGEHLQVAEAKIARDSAIVGKTLAEALGEHVSGATVIGQWVGGKLMAPPTLDMKLEPGGILVLLGNDDDIRSCLALCTGATRLRRQGHFVIAGGGEVGRKVAQLLNDCGETTRTIDVRLNSGADIIGNVLDAQVLEQADLPNAQAVILALAADSSTLFATVILKDLAPDLPVIARVNSAENLDRIYRAGADFALSISQVSGQLLAMQLLGREAVSVDPDLQVVKVSAAGLVDWHPKAPEIREETGCSIVAIERARKVVVRFAPEFRVAGDDVVYVCGDGGAVRRFRERFGEGRRVGPATSGVPAHV